MQKLQTALNNYLRVLAGAPHSTPITLLQSYTGIPPVEILMERTIAANLSRSMTNPECMLETTYNDWDESGWNTTPLEAYHTLRTRLNPPQNTEIGGKERLAQEVMTLYQRIQFEISPNIKLALTKHHQNQLVPKYDICLWTDGSLVREDGKVKAAAGSCYSNDERKEVGNTKYNQHCQATTRNQ